MDGFERIEYEYEFLADRRTPNEMSGAFLGYLHRLGRTWLLYAWLFAGFTLVNYLNFGIRDAGAASSGSRAWAAVMTAVVSTVAVSVILVAAVYMRNLRNARLRVGDGTLLRTGFGDDGFVIDTPLVTARVSYASLTAVRIGRRFVFVRYLGEPSVGIFPRAVFPDAAIAQIAQALGRSGRPTERTS